MNNCGEGNTIKKGLVKPCPFCQSLKLFSVCIAGLRYVRCGGCESNGPFAFRTEEEVLFMWNTRGGVNQIEVESLI